MADAKISGARARPLSPHISIYKPTLTMMMSIAHRITGAALYFGTAILVWWLIAAASGPNAYAKVQWFMGSIVGQVILFGYTWALIHHMFGGIRHFVWDTGHGYGPTEREWLVRVGLAGSVATTIVLWLVGYTVMGGAR
jgi:succinate dehydrogenase / fumarate reductase cytochrome b subunit